MELITKSFADQALAFPDRVESVLAEVKTLEGRQDMLDKAAALQHYAKRLKAGIEIEKPIAIGVLKIKAGIGELLPAKNGRPKKGHENPLAGQGFASDTISAYRKLAANQDRLGEYYESTDDVPSQHGFLKLIQDEQRANKDKAREGKRKRAAQAIAKAETIEDALSAAKFTTICVDPPWDWKDEGDNSQLGRGNTTYGAMSFEQLRELPIGQYADTDAHLYLWITNRSLPKGFALIEDWGFRYVTCITWCKPSFGMGNYFRGATEHMLFAVKGSLSLLRKDAATWFTAPRGPGGHSSKPDESYDLIESCSPGPYLEVFACRDRDGWVSWGGQL